MYRETSSVNTTVGKDRVNTTSNDSSIQLISSLKAERVNFCRSSSFLLNIYLLLTLYYSLLLLASYCEIQITESEKTMAKNF